LKHGRWSIGHFCFDLGTNHGNFDVELFDQKRLCNLSGPRSEKIDIQIALAAAFGVVFIAVLIVIAITIPNPTPLQYLVFRITLALAAGGVAAVIPGILDVRIPNFVTAGGALAVFIIVYFYSPADLAVQKSSGHDSYTAPESVLLQQRKEAKLLSDTLFERLRASTTDLSPVINANNKFLDAELAMNSKPAERVSAYKSALKRAKEIESIVSQHFQSGTASSSDVSEARLYRTQVEIGLAREQSRQ
jgi:hypothetical protein